MRKTWIAVVALLIGFVSFSYYSLGSFLDASEKPKRSDIVVVLGGDWNGWRIKKGLELLNKDYSKSGKILLNPYSDLYLKENGHIYRKEATYLMAHGINRDDIIYFHSWGRTYYELEAIKKFLLKNRYHSVIIVTDPPHTRRVSIIVKYLLHYDKSGLRVVIVGSDAPWWSKNDYYKNETAKNFAYSELLKIPYNIIVYGILERYGILDFLRRIYHYTKETLFAYTNYNTPLKETI